VQWQEDCNYQRGCGAWYFPAIGYVWFEDEFQHYLDRLGQRKDKGGWR